MLGLFVLQLATTPICSFGVVCSKQGAMVGVVCSKQGAMGRPLVALQGHIPISSTYSWLCMAYMYTTGCLVHTAGCSSFATVIPVCVTPMQ